MTPLDTILLEFLKTMAQDLKVRSYDEIGDQKNETLGRVETLKNLIGQIETQTQTKEIL